MPVSGTPAPESPGAGLRLIRAERRTFDGSAEFLSDPGNRAAVGAYLSDLIRSYPSELPERPAPAEASLVLAPAQGHSYGEMAETLISAVTSADQPVDLLVLAYSIHDLQPGRATATYLSHVCPGNPTSFAISDQGSAAAYSGLRIARDYSTSAEPSRSLVIVVEQAALPYGDGTDLPAQHRGVALLFENGPVTSGPTVNGSAGRPGQARLVALTQRPNLAAAAVTGQADADLAELSGGHREVRLVLSQALAAVWQRQPGEQVRVGPADQPSTGIWWQLIDELDALHEPDARDEPGGRDEPGVNRPSLLVAADYDPDLRYLCMIAIEPG